MIEIHIGTVEMIVGLVLWFIVTMVKWYIKADKDDADHQGEA